MLHSIQTLLFRTTESTATLFAIFVMFAVLAPPLIGLVEYIGEAIRGKRNV